MSPILLLCGLAQAQPQEGGRGMTGMGPMMEMGRGWMMFGMVLVGLVVLAVIGALVALTIFLVRHSRPRAPAA